MCKIQIEKAGDKCILCIWTIWFWSSFLTYYDHPGFENIKILNQDVSKGFLLFQNSTGISLSVNVWHHMCTAIDIKNAKMWNVWVGMFYTAGPCIA